MSRLLLAGVVVATGLLSAPGQAWAARRAAAGSHEWRHVLGDRPVTRGSPSQWTLYHGDPTGSGVAAEPLDLASPTAAWRSAPLDGALYGTPLEAAGRVIVATEHDTVYSLAADSGAVLWSRHLGSPVPAADLPCGNIAPTVGVTGTPVIDVSRSEVFVVADVLSRGQPAHDLVGLDLYTGKVLFVRDVDPPGAPPAALLQRTGLTLDHRHVLFGFGGNYGDCGAYHGWVVSVPVSGRGRIRRYETTPNPGDRQGAVWMGGAAPEIARDGNVWLAVGNGAAVSGAYDGSDSVVELSPSLRRIGLFAPRDWATDNAGDRDLGSTAPALLPGGVVLQVGKSSTAYLLRASRPGGVGGQLAAAPVCHGTDAAGGDAVSNGIVFVACRSGLEALAASPGRVTTRWDAGQKFPTSDVPNEPPIVAGGLVWSVGGDALFGLSPASGAAEVRLTIGSNDNDFATPAAGDGLLLVTGSGGDRVIAFAGVAAARLTREGRQTSRMHDRCIYRSNGDSVWRPRLAGMGTPWARTRRRSSDLAISSSVGSLPVRWARCGRRRTGCSAAAWPSRSSMPTWPGTTSSETAFDRRRALRPA
jgi:outer membrane protein assembly factor BamB